MKLNHPGQAKLEASNLVTTRVGLIILFVYLIFSLGRAAGTGSTGTMVLGSLDGWLELAWGHREGQL